MKNKKKGSFNRQFSGIKSQLLKTTKLTDAISRLKAGYYNVNFTIINELIKHPRLRKEIIVAPFPKRLDELKKHAPFSLTNLKGEILWNIAILSVFKTELTNFIELRDKFSKSCLNGALKDANWLLEKIKGEFGQSIWLIQNKILLISLTDGMEAHLKYSKSIVENNNVHDIIRYFTNFYSLRCEKNVSVDKFQNNFNRFEDRVSKLDVGPQMINYMRYKSYKSRQPLQSDDLASLLYFEENSPLIDRLLTLFYIEKCLNVYNDQESEVLSNLIKSFRTSLRNINNSSITNSNPNENYLLTYNYFIKNDFESCFNICRKEVLKDTCNWEHIELFIKTTNQNQLEKIKSDVAPLKYLLLQNLYNCYTSTNRNSLSFNYIDKTLLIFSGHDWSYLVRVFLVKHYSDYFFEKNSSLDFYQSFQDNNYDLFYNNHTQKNSIHNDSNIIDDLFAKLDHNQEVISKIFHLDLYNSLLGIIKYINKDYDKSYNYFKEIDVTNDICYSIKIKGEINCLIMLSRLHEALNNSVKLYLNNAGIYKLIPYKKLIHQIQKSNDNSMKGNIFFPIFLDIQFKNHTEINLDNLKDAYEDFMIYHKKPFPSSLSYENTNIDKEGLIYFLKNICISKVMEIDVINYNSSEALDRERINICRLLSNIDYANNDIYSEEINRITQKLMIDTSTHKLEKNKIYVDIDGIVRVAKREYYDSFLRFISLINVDSEKKVVHKSKFLSIFREDDISFELGTSNKDDLFRSLVLNIRNEFVFNNLYGLDVALSVDIRHGILVGKIRSKFDESHLITKKGADGEYANNNYWADRLDFLKDTETSLLNVILNKFSKEIDEKLNWLNDEIIQIRVEKGNSNGFFDYKIMINNSILALQKKTSKSTSFEDFLFDLINILWKITDENLKSIRNYINNGFKDEINVKFSILLDEIKGINPKYELEELDSAIIDLRTNVTNQLESISIWFNRLEHVLVPNFTLEFMFILAENMINNHFPNTHFKIKSKINHKKEQLTGDKLKPLANVMFILYHNIINHSKIKKQTSNLNVNLDASKNITINLSNVTLKHEQFKETNASIIEIINKFEGNVGDKMIRMQGGTGLYKLDKILKIDLSTEYSISIGYITSNLFEVNLSFNIKNLVV